MQSSEGTPKHVTGDMREKKKQQKINIKDPEDGGKDGKTVPDATHD